MILQDKIAALQSSTERTEPGPIMMQLTCTVNYPYYTVTAVDTIGSQANARVHQCKMEDAETMQLPDDLAPATLNMLTGIGQRLFQLNKWGFEREP